MESVKEALGRKTVLFSLLLILSCGAFFRFYGLGNQSFWNDELASWKICNYDNIRRAIKKGVCPDVHPPGYQVLLFLVVKYIGDSESILRFPSAVAGALSPFMIFLVGARLYTYREGLIASALMAFSWCPIYYSQEARPYSLLLLFSLVSMYFWILLLKDLHRNETNRDYYSLSGYIVSAVTVCYLHYFGLFLIALQGIGAVITLLRKKKALRCVSATYVFVILAYLPWWPVFWQHLNKGPIWIVPPNYMAVLNYLEFCFNNSRTILFCLLPFYLFYAVNSIIKFRGIKKPTDYPVLLNPTFLVLLWLVVPFAIVYIKSILSAPVLTNRNMIIALPAVYLLLARAVATLPVQQMGRRIVPIGIVVLLIGHTLFIRQYYSTPQKQQFREAVNYIVEYDKRIRNDSIIVGWAWNAEYFDYYFDKKHSARRVDMLAGQKEHISRVAKVIAEKAPSHLWLISGHRVPDMQFLDFLKSALRLVDSKTFKGAQVWLFENPKGDGPGLE